MISLPKDLRNTELLSILQENARNLQTHYDTRATLLDCLKVTYCISLQTVPFQHLSNYSDITTLSIPGEKGNSFLRRQEGERNCITLPIPFQYCLCEYPMEQMDMLV